MGHPQSVWKHKKYRGRIYFGRYRYDRKERVFVLTAVLRTGKKHNITFESHEAAKDSGWRKKR